MKKYFVLLTALLAFTAMVVLAADIDGTWTAETQGKNGPQTQKLVLKANGKVLTGSMDRGRGGATEISDGMVDGNNVSFKVVNDFNGKQISREFKGMLNGKTELKLETQGRGGTQEMVFKKQ